MERKIELEKVLRLALVINFAVAALLVMAIPWSNFIYFTDPNGTPAGIFEFNFLLWVIFSIPGVAIIFAAILLKCLWNAVCGVHLLYRNLRNQFAYFR